MTASTNPIFTEAVNTSFVTPSVTANNVYDGTGTVSTLFTAGADGGYVEKIRCKPLGTNIATLARIFINNGGSTGTAANNSLWKEIPLPASTASAVAQLQEIEIQADLPLKPNHILTVLLATTVAAGWTFHAVGGDY